MLISTLISKEQLDVLPDLQRKFTQTGTSQKTVFHGGKTDRTLDPSEYNVLFINTGNLLMSKEKTKEMTKLYGEKQVMQKEIE